MKELELRKPYRLQEIIEIVSKNIANNGFTDSNYCLYSNEGTAQLNQLCYLELYPTIDDNEEEVLDFADKLSRQKDSEKIVLFMRVLMLVSKVW